MRKLTYLVLFSLVFSSGPISHAADDIDPTNFTNTGEFGAPDIDQNTVEYVFWKMLLVSSAESLLGNQPGNWQQRKLDLAIQKLGELGLMDKFPMSAGTLQAALEGRPLVAPIADEKTGFVFTEKTRLRGKLEDWAKSLRNVSGATLSYTDDNKEAEQSLSGTGALVYPVLISESEKGVARDTTLLPHVSWNFKNVANDDESNVEELKFGLPVNWDLQFKYRPKLPQNTWLIYADLFYLTDFDFEGKVVGLEFSADPHLQFSTIPNGIDPKQCTSERCPSWLEIGSYRAFSKKTETAYHLSLIPKLRYSEVLTPSPFISRADGDTELAVGADLELSIRPFAGGTGWEFKGGHSFRYDFKADGDEYSELDSLKASYWLSKNVGISLEYEDGRSPITDKEIDHVLLGLEAKY